MKTLSILSLTGMLALGACSPNWQAVELATAKCVLTDVRNAVHGDVRNIALPKWVPGTHLAGGQLSKCPVPE